MITAETITARYRRRLVSIQVADISHFIASGKYVEAHHSGGVLLLDEPLKKIQLVIPGFVRSHRKILVASRLITGLQPRRLPCGQSWAGLVAVAGVGDLPASRSGYLLIKSLMH